MKTTRALQQLSLVVLCLLLTSCSDSTVPLSDPGDSKADQRLVGIWRSEDEESGTSEYYHIGRFGDPLPKSVMRVVCTHTEYGSIRSGGELLIFPTTIGDKSYLNVTARTDQEIKLVEENGWSPDTVFGYWIFRYRVVDDVLTIQDIENNTKERAVEGGKIKGVKDGFSNVIFTDTTEHLAKFVAEAGDDLFSKDAVRLERVK